MEAPQKIVLPGEVHAVRNSSRYDSKPSGALDPAGIILECNSVTGATAKQRGIISNGVSLSQGVDGWLTLTKDQQKNGSPPRCM